MKVTKLFAEWTELTDLEQIEFWNMVKNYTAYQPVSTNTDKLFQEYDLSCTLCNLKLDKVMGYVCSRSNCPCGLEPVTSSTY